MIKVDVNVQMAKSYGKIVNFCQEFMLEKSLTLTLIFIGRNTYTMLEIKKKCSLNISLLNVLPYEL